MQGRRKPSLRHLDRGSRCHHQMRNQSLVDLGINIGAVYGNEIKMSTPSRSRSSTIGSKGYFNWHESMHRCQQKSERQMQALLHETRRFREENEVLHI
ncbi:hypothetical protein CK203_101505 [Vitis vinifera]|uniref:Uncharacterized protein n=1 Tax=Vitis vinifera TaxID=29760 RepID=A0A438DVD2_VITVI|nr:hypothetical protein CK203_101505 [Vitis vinifera]